MNKVLIVDDEKRMRDLIELFLLPHSFECLKASNADNALEAFNKNKIDLVILDIMMPEVSGFELCQRIRKFSDIPIIMLTARDEQQDVVRGLKLGADDYITKPFDESELIARIEALLRRTRPKELIEVNGLIWNKENFQLIYNQKVINLTPKEFEMVGYLIKNPNKVYERGKLIDLIWGYASDVEGRTIDSHIRNIRDKVRQAGFPIEQHLKTVWGIGYKWIN
ncbi:response regulator transcription factor [Filobacillus milosensis]|uniref:Response regulator transcription factor n=1 Tax=Filobacillus milosensis TaxID=94137 RepID=A0A4Y8IT23_9BACI|nr:response regulator transcription factor [Filobacillus milosensis]TFB25014.1 response regulator transcription factor [Filobacillus milosensis]